MQDNARPHTSANAMNFIQQNGIRTMDWPPLSPNLNPIEPLWDLLERPYPPQAFQQLTDVLIEEWDNIPQKL